MATPLQTSTRARLKETPSRAHRPAAGAVVVAEGMPAAAVVTRGRTPRPMEAAATAVVVAVARNRANGLRRAPSRMYFIRRTDSSYMTIVSPVVSSAKFAYAGAAPEKGSAPVLFSIAELKKPAVPEPAV